MPVILVYQHQSTLSQFTLYLPSTPTHSAFILLSFSSGDLIYLLTLPYKPDPEALEVKNKVPVDFGNVGLKSVGFGLFSLHLFPSTFRLPHLQVGKYSPGIFFFLEHIIHVTCM